MRRQLLGIGLAGLAVLCVILYFAWDMPSLPSSPTTSTPNVVVSSGQPQLPMKTITVGGIQIQAEIASTDAQRQDGLSGRAGLAAGQGMLFIFPQSGNYGFWMKEMSFPIDILWADKNGTIITIWPNLSPSTYPQVFYPTAPAQYVLELPANFAAQNNIAVGAKIVL